MRHFLKNDDMWGNSSQCAQFIAIFTWKSAIIRKFRPTTLLRRTWTTQRPKLHWTSTMMRRRRRYAKIYNLEKIILSGNHWNPSQRYWKVRDASERWKSFFEQFRFEAQVLQPEKSRRHSRDSASRCVWRRASSNWKRWTGRQSTWEQGRSRRWATILCSTIAAQLDAESEDQQRYVRNAQTLLQQSAGTAEENDDHWWGSKSSCSTKLPAEHWSAGAESQDRNRAECVDFDRQGHFLSWFLKERSSSGPERVGCCRSDATTPNSGSKSPNAESIAAAAAVPSCILSI